MLFKLSFLLPKQNKILIYDNNNFQYYKNFLKNYKYEILYIRKEKINFPILIKSIIKNGFKELNYNYKLEYINYVNPKFIITMTDNDLDFLNYRFNDKIKIAIQNAYRKETFPFLFSYLNYEKKKKYNLDYIFCFNTSVGKVYKKLLNAKPIVIGSLKNNSVSLSKSKSKKPIAFISQFRMTLKKNIKYMFSYDQFKVNLTSYYFNKKNFTNITTNNFYKDDENVLNSLLKYLGKRKINLHIIGVLKKQQIFEEDYYKKICKGFDYKFIKNNYNNKSYKILKNYKIIVGVDSTMLYEALAQKKKVGFFSVRKSSFKNHNGYFGYPYNKRAKGEYWSSSSNYNEISRVLKNLFKSSSAKYNKSMKQYLKNLTYYDNKNKKFSKGMIKILKK